MSQRNSSLTLGSLFSGIGGFEYAGVRCGISPIWASEITPACISVTKRHFPNMEHLGDVQGVNGADVAPVGIITCGSPCQNLSISGDRTGLDGAKSSLFFEAVRVIDEMRIATKGKFPQYAVWENVMGSLSAGKPKGNDFKTILDSFTKTPIPMPISGRWAKAGMIEANGVKLAWRALDAQFHGVAQRRKRIFMVISYGEGCPGEALFLEKGELFQIHQSLQADNANSTNSNLKDFTAILRTKKSQRAVFQHLNLVNETGDSGWTEAIKLISFHGYDNPSIGFSPHSPIKTTLSQILENCVPPKYHLSKKACLGVLRRAVKRGKELPPMLRIALEAQANSEEIVMNKCPETRVGEDDVKCLNPWDLQSERVHLETGVSPTLAGADMGGGRRPGGSVFAPIGEIALHPEISGTLCASGAGLNRPGGMGSEADLYVVSVSTFAKQRIGEYIVSDVSSTLAARDYKDATDLVVIEEISDAQSVHQNQSGELRLGDVANSLNTNSNATGRNAPIVMLAGFNGWRSITGSLEYTEECAPCLTTKMPPDMVMEIKSPTFVKYIVRRFVPIETERLQGFPSFWTAYGHDGKPLSDSARYSSIGNSVAIPCVQFVLEGILEQEAKKSSNSRCKN